MRRSRSVPLAATTKARAVAPGISKASRALMPSTTRSGAPWPAAALMTSWPADAMRRCAVLANDRAAPATYGTRPIEIATPNAVPMINQKRPFI